MKEKIRKKDETEEVLLTFLKQTKEGKYTKVEKSWLSNLRVKEQRCEYYYEEQYYYGVR